MNRRSRILLLSAYRADSHAAWSDWLMGTFTGFEWGAAELPGRHFRWRIRGNPLSWLDHFSGPAPDAIVATSMVDLATLRGLHPELARVPALYYFHENQFAYPVSNQQARSVEPQMVQLYGALAAARIAFNSRFNRDSFLDGVGALLGGMPDAVPRGVRERLAARAVVLPVPITAVAPPAAPRDPRLILWNHRWEYDKQPDLFADAMLALAAQGLGFRLALLGPRPRQVPRALARLRAGLGGRVVADGRVSRPEYDAILARAGIAVSTAAHEFQGLAMLEATAAGAAPLVPDALAYPEQYPQAYRYPPGDLTALTGRLARWLHTGPPPPPPVTAWTDSALRPSWHNALQQLTSTTAPTEGPAGADEKPAGAMATPVEAAEKPAGAIDKPAGAIDKPVGAISRSRSPS